MKKIFFITGGARSGKSRYATELAEKYRKKVAFIASGQALDSEMKKRIELHKKSRPQNWITVEEPLAISKALKKIPAETGIIIIDCLTLWLSNLILAGNNEKTIIKLVKALADSIRKAEFSAIIVANEVGSGIVPENKLARDFRDIAGQANQIIAQTADEVYLMIAGLALKLKRK